MSLETYRLQSLRDKLSLAHAKLLDGYLEAVDHDLDTIIGNLTHILAMEQPECHCFHCGHTWGKRKGSMPKHCPKCQNIRWNVPPAAMVAPQAGSTYSHMRCLRCGKEWAPRSVNPTYCPKCFSREWNVAPPADLPMDWDGPKDPWERKVWNSKIRREDWKKFVASGVVAKKVMELMLAAQAAGAESAEPEPDPDPEI